MIKLWSENIRIISILRFNYYFAIEFFIILLLFYMRFWCLIISSLFYTLFTFYLTLNSFLIFDWFFFNDISNRMFDFPVLILSVYEITFRIQDKVTPNKLSELLSKVPKYDGSPFFLHLLSILSRRLIV